uniref:Uncharacterized protein n=1 Tax=Osmundaria fimbriata TaxID=228265 RepID=A0A1Z1M4T2_OSMFI|nr:hypothetical protein [Osmundaria fimbriata]ARW60910.1 hypothetical protein [Osmundaria fimbriata]
MISPHPSIIDLFKESNYNYAIFNKKSFYSLQFDELKLLYYYFYISTLPGSFSKRFSIDNLLKLWLRSEVKQTISKRRKILVELLIKFEENKMVVYDLNIVLEKNKDNISGCKSREKST